MYDIITFGSATQDVLMSPEEFSMHDDAVFRTGKALCLPFGSKVGVEDVVFASGGGGTNAAVTFARQGLSVACISVVGNDANSSVILDELRREGVDGKYIQRRSGSTAYSVVLVGDRGERTILSYKGEGIRWDVSAIPWQQLQTKWFYVNSLGGHFDMLERIVASAKKIGAHLATNPGSQDIMLGLERLAPLLKQFDIVGMNQEEAAMLTGISYDEPEKLFQKLDDSIGGICIMTKGSIGVAVSDGEHLYTAGVPDCEVVERTGAGDAFHAGFLVEFILSGSIEKAIQFGTANSSSVIMQYGAKNGILRKGNTGSCAPVDVTRTSLK